MCDGLGARTPAVTTLHSLSIQGDSYGEETWSEREWLEWEQANAAQYELKVRQARDRTSVRSGCQVNSKALLAATTVPFQVS